MLLLVPPRRSGTARKVETRHGFPSSPSPSPSEAYPTSDRPRRAAPSKPCSEPPSMLSKENVRMPICSPPSRLPCEE